MKLKKCALAVAMLAASAGCTPTQATPTPPTTNALEQFERVKDLAGDWQGKTTMHGQTENAKVRYEVIAGGSAVLETQFAGTPYEMASVYFADGNTVKVTHYCMMGNRPTLTLKQSTPQLLSFEVLNHDGLTKATEDHMHSLTLHLDPDNKKLTEEWVSSKNGDKAEGATVELTRVGKAPVKATKAAVTQSATKTTVKKTHSHSHKHK
jgi:hypothetical protein